jgi:hypothetical protein
MMVMVLVMTNVLCFFVQMFDCLPFEEKALS